MLINEMAEALGFGEKEKQMADRSVYGEVISINDDGSFQVSLNGSDTTTTCAKMTGAKVGDTVLVTILSNGYAVVTGCVGGDTDALDARHAIVEVEQTVEGMETRVTAAEGGVSTLTQRCDGIDLTVSEKLDNDGDDVIAAINIAKGEVKISANKVNIEGEFVTFDDLSESGKTTINGANIKTGTINANRLGLTGLTSSGSDDALVISRTSASQYKVSLGNHSVKAEAGTNSYCYMDELGIHGHYGDSSPYVEIYTGYTGTNPLACYIDPAVNTKNYYKNGTNLDDVYAPKTHYHTEYVQHTQLPGKFSVQTKSISISNLSANSSQTSSATITRTGYTPIGVVGTQVNNGGLVINAAYISGNTLYVRYRNVMGNTDITTATGTIYVLYVSN